MAALQKLAAPSRLRFPASSICTKRSTTHRQYATQGQQPFDSSLLDTKTRPLSGANSESAGPFTLGLSSAGRKQQEAPKKWSELSAAGKVGRTTARTSNLTVILFGAGMSAVLIYALTSELFSKNSPTVLHGEACKRIEASPHLAKYLHAPLTFHNNPPSSTRPRHRNHQVASQLFVDAAGREHLYLHFYLTASSSSSPDRTYLDTLKELPEKVTDVSWDNTKETAEHALERGKAAFKYLVGSAASPDPTPDPSTSNTVTEVKEEVKGGMWKSVFGGLRGAKGPLPPSDRPDGAQGYTEGEVHADLVKNNDGYFVFRYILVDVPDSRSSQPARIWVERGPGVRDSEPQMRWQ